MARYIDADKLYNKVKEKTNPYGKPTLHYESGVKVLDMIKQSPAADVEEVVRCKDCADVDAITDPTTGEVYLFCTSKAKGTRVEPTDFCSYGERKGEYDI